MSPRMFSLFTAGLACLAPLASAYTTPTGSEPKGNPISQPGLNSVVPVDKSFTITWEPTTDGTVSLVLLKGPASNLIPVYAIAEKIENSGSYTWEPKDTLEPSEGAKGYGIQLIDDKTGQYQYTTQFGISNDHYNAKEESSAPAGYASAQSTALSAISSASKAAVSSYSALASSASVAVTSATSEHSSVAPVMTAAASTGAPSNSSVVKPTGAMTVPSSLKSSSTMSKAAYPTGSNMTSTNSTGPSNVEASTGGASNMAASIGGLVIAAGVAVFAL